MATYTSPFIIKAVLFDFDGTLTRPGALDFAAVKEAVGCPKEMPVLEFIESLTDKEKRGKAFATLDAFETKGAEKSEPNPGVEDLICFLRAKKVSVGIISRNAFEPIKLAFKNFKKIGLSDFDIIISRDTPVKPKPDKESIEIAAQKLNIDSSQIMVVGDYIFDIHAGNSAGAVTVFLDNQKEPNFLIDNSDYRISKLGELMDIVRLRLPIAGGKLPNDLLGNFLDQIDCKDPSILIHPGVGEDTAAIRTNQEEILVLTSDPITFVTDSIEYYTVLINANDIATSGATPRWLLTTLLFPINTTGFEILQVMNELKTICEQMDIVLCGGHTEITDAVTRPVATATLAGTVAESRLINKRNMRPGDKVLLTKGVAVEGTAIIAGKFENRLKCLGMSEDEIRTSKKFLSNISILEEARIAGCCKEVSAMHDITEGGLATALKELGIAGRHKIRVNMDNIPVFPETKEICRLLAINPLGLIGSGSLLICCEEPAREQLMHKIKTAGIEVACIGEVLEEGEGIEALKQGEPVEWPCFEADEITRLF